MVKRADLKIGHAYRTRGKYSSKLVIPLFLDHHYARPSSVWSRGADVFPYVKDVGPGTKGNVAVAMQTRGYGVDRVERWEPTVIRLQQIDDLAEVVDARTAEAEKARERAEAESKRRKLAHRRRLDAIREALCLSRADSVSWSESSVTVDVSDLEALVEFIGSEGTDRLRERKGIV